MATPDEIKDRWAKREAREKAAARAAVVKKAFANDNEVRGPDGYIKWGDEVEPYWLPLSEKYRGMEIGNDPTSIVPRTANGSSG